MEIIDAVRDQDGPEVKLFIEGHNRFDFSSALPIAKELETLRVGWFEEPTHFSNIEALGELANASRIPQAIGENFTSLLEFTRLLRFSHNLILQPDVNNIGGLRAALEVCNLGARHRITVAPHNAQGPVTRAACLQLASMCPEVFILEDFDAFNWQFPVVLPRGHLIVAWVDGGRRGSEEQSLCLADSLS